MRTLFGVMALMAAQSAFGQPATKPFIEAKTTFQTNSPYDPRIALGVDAVIVHRHGERGEPLAHSIGSWKKHGYALGRMFFADSDARNEYWTGKWDGVRHEDEVERDASGGVVMCSGVRPYMLPTDGWIRYLEEMTRDSIAAGADAVLPEEPLAHVHTGYEGAFKRLWRERYNTEWHPESASLEARFRTAQLKNELYLKLEQRLAEVVQKAERETGRDISFVVPIHSLYSNVASRLVAPLGTSLSIKHVDGYIGQIWTGPVRWALHHYGSPDKSFFASAYVLYDFFVQIADGTERKLWLLGDPVEDDPNHQWHEFEQWYQHCVTAKLLFDSVDSYEVMPWPDRIFLPGHQTGGGTPAPEDYRIALLSIVQVLQEITGKGEWRTPVTEGIGVALSDTVMWEKEAFPPLDAVYGLLLPLVNEGVPVEACLAERAVRAPGDLDQFKVIVLSYDAWKPISAVWHEVLNRWVRAGGVLVLLGEPDDLGGAKLWWAKAGFPSPLHHLGRTLGVDIERDGEQAVGKGLVVRRNINCRAFADPNQAADIYLPLIDLAMRKAGDEHGLRRPGAFCMRRGDYVIAHALRKPVSLSGTYLDVFDPKLPIVDGISLPVGHSGVFKEVGSSLLGDTPKLLHATHRLIAERHAPATEVTIIDVRGPAETPGLLRIYTGGHDCGAVTVRPLDSESDLLKTAVEQQGDTVLIRFPNDPAGVRVAIEWR